MSEEQTERLEGSIPFETRVLSELANINQRLTGVEGRLSGVENRLTGLEDKVDARLRETRPIWETVLTRLERIENKLDVFGRDVLETRVDVEMLKKRLPVA